MCLLMPETIAIRGYYWIHLAFFVDSSWRILYQTMLFDNVFRISSLGNNKRIINVIMCKQISAQTIQLNYLVPVLHRHRAEAF